MKTKTNKANRVNLNEPKSGEPFDFEKVLFREYRTSSVSDGEQQLLNNLNDRLTKLENRNKNK